MPAAMRRSREQAKTRTVKSMTQVRMLEMRSRPSKYFEKSSQLSLGSSGFCTDR